MSAFSLSETQQVEKRPFVIKLKKEVSIKNKEDLFPNFKDYVYQQILSKIIKLPEHQECTQWTGYKQKYRLYSVACHIVHFKSGKKHYINPQKYIYNYLNNPTANYNELIRMTNRVRNIDECKNRGQCCHLNHIEAF